VKDAKLSDFMEFEDQKIILVYDFLRMWIFLIELIERSEEDLTAPKVALSIGLAPPEDSKMIQEDAFGSDEFDEDDELNDFDDEFEDGYNDEDFGGYEEYEY
jgi:hypothetical protein